MTSDDPFSSPQSDDRTIIRPVPGGKHSDIPPPFPAYFNTPITDLGLGSLNILEKAASGLLALLTRINTSHSQTDPAVLKSKITEEIQNFQVNAQTNGIDTQTIYNARYVLCTALDEAVLNTPWGNDCDWFRQSLLSLFHKEASGGNRFFDLLQSMAQNPGKNRNILELMYLILAFGYEGQYRNIEDGKHKLASIRQWLYELIEQNKEAVEQTLSPHWQGVIDRRNPLVRLVPTWVFGLIAAALLAILFSVLLFRLNEESDAIFGDLYKIKFIPPEIPLITLPIPPSPPPPPQASKPTLSNLLADEISLDKVKLSEEAASTLTILGDNLFESGSPSINESVVPLLQKIAGSLNQLEGEIVITGHSDNRPIRSTRYPSNWHLSIARASAVADIIKENLNDPLRVTVDGKSDLEPIAGNDTAEGRAKNRRVEVTLK